MAVFADLRYSARSLTRTPGLTLALLLTIALGIGSNASVFGFIHGSVTPNLPLAGIDRVVSLSGRDAQDAYGPISYESYLSLKTRVDVFEWVGAARESQGSVVLDDRPAMMSVAAVTPEVADFLHVSPGSPGDSAVISDRVRRIDFAATAGVDGERIRVDGLDTSVAGVAPDWLDGLYVGRGVDIWMPLREASLQGLDRSSRMLWTFPSIRRKRP